MVTERTKEDVRSERESRVFFRYAFFKASREWRSLGEVEKQKGTDEFLKALGGQGPGMQVGTYSLVGTRGDTDFMLWLVASDLHDVQDFVAALLRTGLGKHLDVPYSFLAMSKRSRYLGTHRHEGQESESGPRTPGGSKYLFVYPLVKKREWYKVPFTERQRMMADHFKVGHRFPAIKINTGYSFGLDDQEFVVAFEGDSPAEFLDLVEELRTSDASKYTERETPIFTCVAVDPRTMVKLLG